ncbi:O-methyltransferase-like protein [Thermochaetoides thermophila DSM 1495]|uniref:O-methyltransferase-like protein n=1 Tax=Chaetomium thermophilum (strain DSM 1495 / CBS 144.50 / IMI 039719) TaxID=759272 RepID=G0S8Q4_CHATD|nr:O-methyltransferase-like protein [Thermochaetoides thermophila DSM 1495]EGS20257.1 O-methyltransferase-like protein [Thermochaetoides thermophila DSM 1495]
MTDFNHSDALAQAKALIPLLETFDGSLHQRKALLKHLNDLRSTFEHPSDIFARWQESMCTASALDIMLRLGAWKKIPDDGTPITAGELASGSNVDESVITRAMRILVTAGLVDEVDIDTYRRNALTSAFQADSYGSLASVGLYFVRGWGVIPSYSLTHATQDIFDPRRNPIVCFYGQEGKTFYEVLDGDPMLREMFDTSMYGLGTNLYQTEGLFPFEGMREQVMREPERVFVVDVGGGKGHVLREIRAMCGGDAWGRRLVLQDLPVVVDSLEKEDIEGFEVMEYDFHTEQPVKNAHIYFLRMILHNYYDPVCITILKNQARAMGPDSRLIVCEMLVPDKVEVGAPMDVHWMNFSMLMLGGKERRLAEFEDIFEQAGLEIAGVWRAKAGYCAMIEGRLRRTG